MHLKLSQFGEQESVVASVCWFQLTEPPDLSVFFNFFIHPFSSFDELFSSHLHHLPVCVTSGAPPPTSCLKKAPHLKPFNSELSV